MTYRCIFSAFIALFIMHKNSNAFVPIASKTPRHHTALSSSRQNNNPSNNTNSMQQKLSTFFTSTLLTTAIISTPINVQINHYPSIIPSTAHAYTENQRVINEIWSTVTSQYYDPTFNGLGIEGWKSTQSTALEAVQDTGPEDEGIVLEAIQNMLGVLNDPYTRYLPREKYEVLTAYATGSSSGGIGVQLLEDARSKNIMIMGVTENGPANKAGLRVGDVIISIDGESMEQSSAEVVAAKCRGEVGTVLQMDVFRDGEKSRSLSMTREKIIQYPVKATTFSSAGKTIGVLRIPSFSTETVSQMVDGLRFIVDSQVDVIAIDLRGNVGGYMPAGVDAAKLFLPARSRIISEVGKSGVSKVYEANGIGAETSIPLYVVVDKRTASAAEIFAAALQDNDRALIVGMTSTFGKGRIQNVKPLENGSGVAVTRAKYVTPRGKDIQGVGILPDKTPSQCGAGDSVKTCLNDVLIIN